MTDPHPITFILNPTSDDASQPLPIILLWLSLFNPFSGVNTFDQYLFDPRISWWCWIGAGVYGRFCSGMGCSEDEQVCIEYLYASRHKAKSEMPKAILTTRLQGGGS